jgi:magnesium chelatase family protein
MGKVSKIFSAGVIGIDAYDVEVEVDISQGIPSFNIVGLPDSAVKESRDRVKSAIKNSGFEFPLRRITVNLAPADIKKEGSFYDLPIALGILSAEGIINSSEIQNFVFVGELSLDGRLKGVSGIVPIAVYAKQKGVKIIAPEENTEVEYTGVDGFYARNLSEVIKFFKGELELPPIPSRSLDLSKSNYFEVKIDDIKGHEFVKRALLVSACGGHNLLMIGPPGAGKTLLAKSIISILPPLEHEEEIEVMKIYSVAGLKRELGMRPFRAPHYTISDVAMVGGGSIPKPGEVSLAHRGILFLDELPEFKRHTLEALRIPIEEKRVTISRAQRTITFPASFQLISAMNPCPCGNFRNPKKECRCNPSQIKKYVSKISGPLLDRFDMFIEVPALEADEIFSSKSTSETDSFREKVIEVRKIQRERYKEYGFFLNSEIPPSLQDKFLTLDQKGEEILKDAIRKFSLSARAVFRILKISRTVADIYGSEDIKTEHILEALSFRRAENFFNFDYLNF